MAGRTLTQHAVPITFGLKVSGWLTGVLDAADALGRTRSGLAAQVGGAAGTLAAATQLARTAALDDPVEVASGMTFADGSANALGLCCRRRGIPRVALSPQRGSAAWP